MRWRRGGTVSETKGFELELSDKEWETRLGRERYEVLRKGATEPPFTGTLLHVEDDGSFTCGGCGQALFASDHKFDSGSGWPSFDQAIEGTVLELEDRSHFMRRTEIVCSRCGGHLGHVFNDGPTTTGMRYCVNSLSVDFEPVAGEGSGPSDTSA
jgi:peptide-methionine (R)-S-oxide reductase